MNSNVTGYIAGGIVGKGKSDTICNCQVLGTIKGEKVGGISYSDAKMKNSYFAGEINSNCLGGLQYYSGTYENSYYLNTIPSAVYNKLDTDFTGIKALSESEMKATKAEDGKATFLEELNNYVENYNASSDNIYKLKNWKIDKETGYPTLSF